MPPSALCASQQVCCWVFVPGLVFSSTWCVFIQHRRRQSSTHILVVWQQHRLVCK